MKTISQDIKSGEFKQIYLLFGEEAFLRKSYKNRLKAALVGDDTMNYHYFEGKGLDIREIISLADTMPFFGERRLIQIEDAAQRVWRITCRRCRIRRICCFRSLRWTSAAVFIRPLRRRDMWRK